MITDKDINRLAQEVADGQPILTASLKAGEIRAINRKAKKISQAKPIKPIQETKTMTDQLVSSRNKALAAYVQLNAARKVAESKVAKIKAEEDAALKALLDNPRFTQSKLKINGVDKVARPVQSTSYKLAEGAELMDVINIAAKVECDTIVQERIVASAVPVFLELAPEAAKYFTPVTKKRLSITAA